MRGLLLGIRAEPSAGEPGRAGARDRPPNRAHRQRAPMPTRPRQVHPVEFELAFRPLKPHALSMFSDDRSQLNLGQTPVSAVTGKPWAGQALTRVV